MANDLKWNIIFRACDCVEAAHKMPRPFNLNKRELIKVCFHSLFTALQGCNFEITIVGDRLSQETLNFFAHYPIKNYILGEFNNEKSLRKCYEFATTLPDSEWVYFCEDDYLHKPSCMAIVNEFINNKQQYLSHERCKKTLYLPLSSGNFNDMPLIIFPSDYPDRYQKKGKVPSYLFLSKHCHWRQIKNLTLTNMLKVATFKQYQKIFFKAMTHDGELGKHLFASFFLKNKALALSPIPGLTSHMHVETMSVLDDWRQHYLNTKENMSIDSALTASFK